MTKYITATVADDQTLFADLIVFLTTDVTLVSASEDWTEVWDHANGDEDGIVLEGPGLGGTDQIYVGMRLVRDTVAGNYAIEIMGMTGFNAGAVDLEDHVNVMPEVAKIFVDDGSQTYWFIANGRRFVVINKITTVFGAAYAGWFLPFGTPSEYPYPMFIGGSAGYYTNDAISSPESWRDNVEGHTQFPWPSWDSSGTDEFRSPAWTLDPSGNWMRMSNVGEVADGTVGQIFARGNKYDANGDTNDLLNPEGTFLRITDLFGGDKMIWPLTLHETGTGSQTYGVLDGCFKCQGDGMGAEDTITIATVNHLVVQNAYRTDFPDYWCVELP